MTSTPTAELESRLRDARENVERLRPKASLPKGDSGRDEYRHALEIERAAERDLSLARGEPACVAVDWQPRWSPDAPSPHVLVARGRTFLVYAADGDVSDWETRAVRVGAGIHEIRDRLVVVEFKGVLGQRFGGPNDEAWSGRTLYGRGLDSCGAYLVANSPWIGAERNASRAGATPRPEGWEQFRHYLLLFHDDVFECIAEGHSFELFEASFGDVLGQLAKRVAQPT